MRFEMLSILLAAINIVPNVKSLHHFSDFVQRPWMTVTDPPAERARKLLAAMDIMEKVHMMHGNNSMHPYVGAVMGNDRLKIPSLMLNDGPQGFRDNDGHPGTSTSFPSGLNIGATFDQTMAQLWGETMGEEFSGKGSNVQLGPGLCLARIPLNGRNFEYMSGEDPFLGYIMVQPAVKGIQSKGVIATAKHYVNNNQETNRTTNTAHIDERTQYEMYYPPFEGAIRAGVGSVMCSYNKISIDNGPSLWSCQNPTTLQRDLKERMNFSGWVMSDWGAAHAAKWSFNAGLDQIMPGGGTPVEACVRNGTVSWNRVDEAALRILTPMFERGLFDNPNNGSISANVTSIAHNMITRKLAASSMVLLKNEGILPLKDTLKTIAVIGSQAENPIVSGGGSGSVHPYYRSAPLDAINARFQRGCDYIICGIPTNPVTNFWGSDIISPTPHTNTSALCCALCKKTPECIAYSWHTSGSCYVKRAVTRQAPDNSVTSSFLKSPPPHPPPDSRCVVFDDGRDLIKAATTAAKANVTIIFAATNSGEGRDRKSLSLNDNADELIKAVSNVTKSVVVVMVHPGAVLTPWRDSVQGIIAAFLPGQEYGNALADVLSGDVSPTARLPLTFPTDENQQPFSEQQYPGINNYGDSYYSEKLQVGYRYFDAHKINPAFPFGHGLTYTKFEYTNLKANPTAVKFLLKNIGSRDGAEIVQLYLGFPVDAGEPPKQLKGFQKISLAVGASTLVTLPLDTRALSIWNVTSHDWSLSKGTFTAMVGSSSRDIRLNATFVI